MTMLRTTYPCCGAPARFKVTPGVLRSAVTRVHFCAPADETGTAYRVSVVSSSTAVRGVDLHALTWLDLASPEAEAAYGTRRVPHRTPKAAV